MIPLDRVTTATSPRPDPEGPAPGGGEPEILDLAAAVDLLVRPSG